jgi:hypothetical protein
MFVRRDEMKKFWLGVGVGVLGTLSFCAIFGFSFNLIAAQHFREGTRIAEFPPPIVMRGIFGSRGEFGVIDEIDGQTIMLTTRDGTKRAVVVSSDTDIYRNQQKVKLDDLSKGVRIVVIGSIQSDGTLKAKLIRVVSSSMFKFTPPTEQS